MFNTEYCQAFDYLVKSKVIYPFYLHDHRMV
jgi:hypothetical protein